MIERIAWGIVGGTPRIVVGIEVAKQNNLWVRMDLIRSFQVGEGKEFG